MKVLEVKNLNVTFPVKDRRISASRNISLSLEEGEICVIVGETGSGKSVIGSAVLHLLPKTAEISGSIRYHGREILRLGETEYAKLRGREISLIPQNPTGSLSPLMRCGKQIEEVLRYIPKKERPERVNRMLCALNFVNPLHVAHSYPYELSGGMRQRLTAGIALAAEPRLLIADEPTKGLDYAARKTVLEMFSILKKKRKDSVLMITHDLELAQSIGDTIGVLYSGEFVEFGTAEEIFGNPQHPYTKGLIAALPKNGMVPMPGICPDLSALPDGCSFHDRCPHPCTGESVHPDLQDVSGRLVRCHRFCG
jgi:peptide/nickel transport system ATP-binding protein